MRRGTLVALVVLLASVIGDAQGLLRTGRMGRAGVPPPEVASLELSYVGVGTADSDVGNNSLFPTLPSSYIANDLLVCAVWQRNAIVGADDTIAAITSGWTEFAGGNHDTNQAGGQMALFSRIAASSNETAPEFDLTGAEGADTTVALCFAFRNADLTTPIETIGTFTSATATVHIGPITGITPATSGSAVVVVGGKGSAWSSVATLTTDALLWAEIGEPDTATGDDGGLVADYVICDGSCGTVGSATFTVTGATNVASSGIMFSIKPAAAGTIPEPPVLPFKFKTTDTFPPGSEEADYSSADIACLENGTTPYATIALASGETLPSGLSLSYTPGDTCATISGTIADSTAGTYIISLDATDGAAPVVGAASQDFTLVIAATVDAPVITTTVLDGGESGVAYGPEVISSQDGSGTLSWTITTGSLPTGLTNPFPTTGATVTIPLSTPTASGTFNFTVQVCDDQARCDTQALSIAIATPAPDPEGTPIDDAAHPRLLLTADSYSTSGATRAEICTRVAGVRNADWVKWIDQLDALWDHVGTGDNGTLRARMKGYAFVYALVGSTATTNPCGAKLLPNGRTSTDYGDKAAALIESMVALACTAGWAKDGYSNYNSSQPFVYDWIYARLVARGTDDDVRAKLRTCMNWNGATTMYDDSGGTVNGRHVYKALAIKNDGECATTEQAACDGFYGNITAGYGEFFGTLFDAASPDGGWSRGYEYMIHSGNPYLFYPLFLESYRTSHLLAKNTFYGNADQYTLVKNLPYQWLHALHPKSFTVSNVVRWYVQATNNLTSPRSTNSNDLKADLSFARIVKEGDPTSANLSEWLLRNRVTSGKTWNFTVNHDLTYAIEGLWLVDDGAITGPAAAGIPTSRFFDGTIGTLSSVTAWEDPTATSWQLHGSRYHVGTYFDIAAGSFSVSRNGPLIVRDGINAHETWSNKHGFSALFLGNTDLPQMTLVDGAPTTKVKPVSATPTRLDFFAADGTTPTGHGFVAGDITATQTVWILWQVSGAGSSQSTQHGDYGAGRAYWCRLTTIVDSDTIGCTYDQAAGSNSTVTGSGGVVVTTTAQAWRHYTGLVPPVVGGTGWDRGSVRSYNEYGISVCCGSQLTTAQSAYLRGMSRHRLSEGSYDYDYGYVDYTKFYNGALGTDGTNASKLSSGTRSMVGYGRDSSGIDLWIIYDRITTENSKYEKLIKFTPAGAATGVSYAVDGTPTAVRTGRTDYNDGSTFTVTNQATGSNGKLMVKWVATGATAAINIRKTGGQGACSWSRTDGLGACDHSREDAWGRQIDNGSEVASGRDKQFGVGHSIWFVPDSVATYNTFAFCMAAGTAAAGASQLTSIDCENLGGTNWESIRNGTQVAAFARTETTHTSGTIPYPSTSATFETTIFDVTGARSFTAGANISAVTQVDTGRNCLTQTCTAGDANDIRINVTVTSGGTVAARTLTVN